MNKTFAWVWVAVTLVGCAQGGGDKKVQEGAQQFLDTYNTEYAKLYTVAQEAEWASNTRIVEGDSTNSVRTRAAQEAVAAYTGSIAVIDSARAYLKIQDQLTPLQARQFKAILFKAGNSPQTVADVVKRRIAAEAAQTEKLYGFTFRMNGKTVTPNVIDSILNASTNLTERRTAWVASKEVGTAIKPGIVTLRDLRNQVVRGLGYSDFFSYQVADYDMTSAEMLALCDTLNAQLRPLYRELHTWARYELAKRYNQPVPEYLPADWLPNRWGQDWSSLVKVSGLDVDPMLASKTPEWIVQQGEAFYKSIGFPALPASFWTKSSLYPVPADSPFKKNTHASAWHINYTDDVRSLMSVEPNTRWYGTAHHELGHIYYYIAYSTPEVPIILREGANRAYHEGIGTLMQLASSQRRFLAGRGLVSPDAPVDTMAQMLKEALQFVVFIPFSTGTMTRFEHALYADSLSPDRFNAAWWDYAKQYQGIVPPTPRDESFADGLTKTHINDDPAQYYDYALSQALLFQLHQHIATKLLKQNPHDTDYYGSKPVGDFLRALMAPGASRPWRDVLKETTGRPLDAHSMVEYFAPLHEWLKLQNKGRRHTI